MAVRSNSARQPARKATVSRRPAPRPPSPPKETLASLRQQLDEANSLSSHVIRENMRTKREVERLHRQHKTAAAMMRAMADFIDAHNSASPATRLHDLDDDLPF